MKSKMLIFCMFSLLSFGANLLLWTLTAIAAPSTPILVVAGKVTDSNGRSVPKGLTVVVENQTKNLTLENAIGADKLEEGTYTVTFINFEGKSMATSGDKLKVSVKEASGKVLAAETYQVKDADIDTAYVRIDLKIQALVLSTPIFVVAGNVTYESEKGLKDALLIVENQANKLVEKVKLPELKSENKYAATFFNFEGKSVAQVGDVIKVSIQNATGALIESQAYQLKEADIAAAQAIINLRIPKSAVSVESKGKLYLIWAKLKGK